MKDDGSTSGGCWIYTGVYADGVNQATRRKPGREQSWVAPEWGWAWPMNRRILYNRAVGRPRRQAVERAQGLRLVGRGDRRSGPATTCPTSRWARPPSYRPARGRRRPRRAARGRPVHHAGGREGLAVRAGRAARRAAARPTTSRRSPRSATRCTGSRPTRRARCSRATDNLQNPSGDEPGVERVPVRVHHLPVDRAPHGRRHEPFPAVPRPSCSRSSSARSPPSWPRERGLENNGWATIVSARTAIEARVLVTERVAPLRMGGRTVHQIGLPYHWGVGARGPGQRRLGQRPVRRHARPERAHPGDQGRLLRHPAGPPARAARRCWTTWPSTGPGPASPRPPATCSARRRVRTATQRARRARTGRRRADSAAGRPRGGGQRDEPAETWADGRPADRTRRSPRRNPAGPPCAPAGRSHRRARASSPTPRSASAARPARSPARSGTGCPQDGISSCSGSSYDNTGALGASTWRHVEFIEQRKPLAGQTTGVTIGVPETAAGPDVLLGELSSDFGAPTTAAPTSSGR